MPRRVENEIVGEALVALQHDDLKQMGIGSVGHRLTILKSVYEVKKAQDVPIERDHYVPLCTYPFCLLSDLYFLLLPLAPLQRRADQISPQSRQPPTPRPSTQTPRSRTSSIWWSSCGCAMNA